MEIARQWLEVQRATPSFAGGDATLHPVNDGILHGPLPAGLDYDTSGNRRSASSNPYQQQQLLGGDSGSYYYAGGVAAASRNDNSMSYASRGGVPVHDQLLAKGKLYQQRKEAMKERHVSEQLRHLRNPKLSEEASKLRREETVVQRFYRLQQQKEEKQYYAQQQREKEDERTLARSFKPSITSRARQASARITSARGTVGDALEAQIRRREEKASQIRLKYMMQDMAEVREVPSINPVSERLAARRREKEGLGGMSHLEAMIERDRLRRAELWERQRERETEEVAHPFPKITLYAANLQRDGDAAERLYQESIENEARRAERIQARLDDARRTASHTPRITALAAATARQGGAGGEPIEDELMRRHLDAMAHREELIRQQVERERDRRNPAINPVSDTIASRLPQTARERLLQPKAQYVDANEPNFTPRINQPGITSASRAGATSQQQQQQQQRESTAANNNSGNNDNVNSYPDWDEQQQVRAQQTDQYQTRKAERIRQLREEAEQREMAECTFRPTIHSIPGSSSSRGGGGGGEDGGGGVGGGAEAVMMDDGANVVERSNQWLKRREAKLQAQRLALQQQQDSSAIGVGGDQPRRQHSPTARNPTLSAPTSARHQQLVLQQATAGPLAPAAGVDSFVERLEEGRRRRHEQYTKLYATGSKWTGEATVPPNSEYGGGGVEGFQHGSHYHQQQGSALFGGGGAKSSSRERSYGGVGSGGGGGGTSVGNVRSLRPPLQDKVSLSILSP